MKKALLFFAALAIGPSAFATSYRCSLIGNGDYSVEVNLLSKKAAFFDNDNWSIIPLSQANGSSFSFIGQDNYDDMMSIKVVISGQTAVGVVSYMTDSRVATNRLSCYQVAPKDLYSGI